MSDGGSSGRELGCLQAHRLRNPIPISARSTHSRLEAEDVFAGRPSAELASHGAASQSDPWSLRDEWEGVPRGNQEQPPARPLQHIARTIETHPTAVARKKSNLIVNIISVIAASQASRDSAARRHRAGPSSTLNHLSRSIPRAGVGGTSHCPPSPVRATPASRPTLVPSHRAFFRAACAPADSPVPATMARESPMRGLISHGHRAGTSTSASGLLLVTTCYGSAPLLAGALDQQPLPRHLIAGDKVTAPTPRLWKGAPSAPACL
ncbi:hypothetical protein B0J12DRAFT_39238 [Macrophomina phaseolina]|uniref:Uncharacterized protein n=1 Tax=Macrophomina phaseolina TaxID=35725 RepID=A0ABQ8GWB6_9PEZI|nr:hypothetical protein B0J12DRAFT_39238 [Macrophomina phaseolina]